MFATIRMPFVLLPMGINLYAQSKASMVRFDALFNKTKKTGEL